MYPDVIYLDISDHMTVTNDCKILLQITTKAGEDRNIEMKGFHYESFIVHHMCF